MIFNDYFYNKNSIIFSNVRNKKEIISKLTNITKLNIIIITTNKNKFNYLKNPNIKFCSTANIKINKNWFVIVESLKNKFHFHNIKTLLLDKYPLNNIVIISEIRNFNLINQYQFNNIIINNEYLNFKLKLKLFYIRLFKYKFSDLQEYLIWIKKNKHKKWLFYQHNSKKIIFFNLVEFCYLPSKPEINEYELLLDYVYS